MSGDGPNDIVRVQNGEVCYWPNLGHARFGAKVTMANAPVFERARAFRPAGDSGSPTSVEPVRPISSISAAVGPRLHLPNAPGRHVFGGRPSELLMSRTIFNEPSACFFQTVRYLPLWCIAFPPFGVTVHSTLPVSIA